MQYKKIVEKIVKIFNPAFSIVVFVLVIVVPIAIYILMKEDRVKNTAGLLTFLSLMGAMGWYYPLILRRRVNPAPATWIIGCFAMNLAMVSYHAIPGRTLIENITLYAAAFEITIVLVLLVVMLLRSGEFRVAFDWMQKLCLVVMAVTLIYWAFNKKQAGVTFWTTQALLVVAYLATITKAIQRRIAFDSIGNWSFVFAGSIIGSIPAFMMASPYGIANSVRAIVASGITVAVLIYYDRKNGQSCWKNEKETIANFYRIRRACSAVNEAPRGCNTPLGAFLIFTKNFCNE